MTPLEIAEAYASGRATFRSLMESERMQYRDLKAILAAAGVQSRRRGGVCLKKAFKVERHNCNERGRPCTLEPGAERCAICCSTYMVELMVARRISAEMEE